MRVKISYTVDVDDTLRRAISHHYGRPKLATRDEIKRWFETYGDSATNDILSELENDQQDESDD